MFVTRFGEQCIISSPMVPPTPWTRQTYDLLHEYLDARARTGGSSARESAGAAFILIASDLLLASLGPGANWAQLDVDLVAQHAGIHLPFPAAREHCQASLLRFARLLAETGRISEQARLQMALHACAKTRDVGH